MESKAFLFIHSRWMELYRVARRQVAGLNDLYNAPIYLNEISIYVNS